MASAQFRRCAALLFLHVLLLACVAAGKRKTNPRGWKAAKAAEEAERRQLAAAAAGAAWSNGATPDWVPPMVPGSSFPQLPAAAEGYSQQQQQQQQQPAWALQRPVPPLSWLALAAASTAIFLAGMAAGVTLHAALLRRRRPRRSPALASKASRQEGAEPCAAEQAGADAAQRRPEQLGGTTTAAAKQSEGGKQWPPAEGADSAPAGPAGEEGVGETPPAAAAAAAAAATPAASESAVAEAVQELVLHAGRGTAAVSPASAAASGGSGEAAAGATEGESAPDLQLASVLAAAGGGEAGGGGGGGGGASAFEGVASALGRLRPDDQADIQAAAQLVLAMCGSMHMDPSQMSRAERLQLIHSMLQVWQAHQARRHAEDMARLHSEANQLRSQQTDIAARTAARQAARDAYRLSLERTAAFRRLCSDTLTFGLVVMAATAAHQLASRGVLAHLTHSCPSPSAALGSRWGLWAAWRAAEALSCCTLALGDALLGLAVLLAAPWIVYRSGLMSDYHAMPLSKLFVGLGLICGLAGYLAVGKLGGARGAWLACWEAWVALHVAFSAAAHRMHRIHLRAAQSGPGGSAAAVAAAAAAADAASSMYEDGGGWLALCMWALLGVALPLLAGTLPFRLGEH